MMIDNKIYNPASQPKEWLIEHFVVRTNVFEKLFKDIQRSKMKYPEQHYLIQGQRGMGKTTLLLRLKYEIENTPALNKWLVPVFFNEESYDLTSLSNLWEKLFKYLDDLWHTGGIYYKKTDDFVGKADYEKKCFNYLESILKTEKKKLVILFDNFGQLFLDNLKPKEQHRFREILMQCADIRIIGASAVVLEDLYDYSKPFFDFFKIINLEGLDKDETVQLIAKLNEKSDVKIDIDKNKSKIETLAILTGGVIRTIMLIYEVILADEDGSALRDLETVLDRITPLYKHRIEDLPVQQRRIVDVIAKKWDAVSAKEIAENIRDNGQPIATKLISAQLQQLEKNNVIEKKQTNTKNYLYQLKERFFNIWYLMRNGDRNDKCRVIWLTKFLELWYDDEKSFDIFLEEHIKHLRSGKYNPNSAIIITEAISRSNKVNILSLDQLVKTTASLLNDEQKKMLPDITLQKIESSSSYYKKAKYDDAISVLKTIDSKEVYQNIMLALCYAALGDFAQVKDIIEGLVPIKDHDTLMISILYKESGDIKKSIDLLTNYQGEEMDLAYDILGECYKKLNDYPKAISYFKNAITLGNKNSYYSLIKCLMVNYDFESVEKYSFEAIDKGVKNIEPMLIQGYIFSNSGINEEKAESMLKIELKKYPDHPVLNHLMGQILFFKGDIKRAEKLFIKVHNIFVNGEKPNSYYYEINMEFLFDCIISRGSKKEAEKLLNDIKGLEDPIFLLYSSFVYVWNNEYKKAMDSLSFYVDGQLIKDINPKDISLINETLLLLLAKKQYHSVLKIFENKKLNLKEQLKPIYYALMYYLKEEYPNEYLKMGDELKQPVEDIMKKVKEMAVEYV